MSLLKQTMRFIMPFVIIALALVAVVLLPRPLLAVAIILLGLLEIIAPYKVFKWREDWKPKAWREENLSPRQITVFVWTIRIGGAVVVIAGIYLLIYVN